jgi:hypothetical protein
MKVHKFNKDHRKSLTKKLLDSQWELSSQLRLLIKDDVTEEMKTFIRIDIELLEARIEHLVELISENKISI